MNALHPNEALAEIFRLVRLCNKYIDITAPWLLAKDEAKRDRLGTVLYNLAECLRIVAVCLRPFLTRTAPKIFEQLGVADETLKEFDSAAEFGKLPEGTIVKKGEALFPRIDVKKELEQLEALLPKPKQAAEEKAEAKSEVKSEEKPAEPALLPEISYDDFAKLDLRLAKVIACEEVKKSKNCSNARCKWAVRSALCFPASKMVQPGAAHRQNSGCCCKSCAEDHLRH